MSKTISVARQRLKFAYARGARIQVKVASSGHWVSAHAPGFHEGRKYRIDPRDAHLEYGPLSSALRRLAESPGKLLCEMEKLAGNWMMNPHNVNNLKHCDLDDQEDVWLLLMGLEAELLADEGL